MPKQVMEAKYNAVIILSWNGSTHICHRKLVYVTPVMGNESTCIVGNGSTSITEYWSTFAVKIVLGAVLKMGVCLSWEKYVLHLSWQGWVKIFYGNKNSWSVMAKGILDLPWKNVFMICHGKKHSGSAMTK